MSQSDTPQSHHLFAFGHDTWGQTFSNAPDADSTRHSLMTDLITAHWRSAALNLHGISNLRAQTVWRSSSGFSIFRLTDGNADYSACEQQYTDKPWFKFLLRGPFHLLGPEFDKDYYLQEIPQWTGDAERHVSSCAILKLPIYHDKVQFIGFDSLLGYLDQQTGRPRSFASDPLINETQAADAREHSKLGPEVRGWSEIAILGTNEVYALRLTLDREPEFRSPPDLFCFDSFASLLDYSANNSSHLGPLRRLTIPLLPPMPVRLAKYHYSFNPYGITLHAGHAHLLIRAARFPYPQLFGLGDNRYFSSAPISNPAAPSSTQSSTGTSGIENRQPASKGGGAQGHSFTTLVPTPINDLVSLELSSVTCGLAKSGCVQSGIAWTWGKGTHSRGIERVRLVGSSKRSSIDQTELEPTRKRKRSPATGDDDDDDDDDDVTPDSPKSAQDLDIRFYQIGEDFEVAVTDDDRVWVKGKSKSLRVSPPRSTRRVPPRLVLSLAH